ncbi:MAG: hypothetical protein ACI8UO_004107 [Verrucomicrobiales bacterium]|jgi:hypothetical protein
MFRMKSVPILSLLVLLLGFGLTACVSNRGGVPEVVVLIPEGSPYAEEDKPIDFVSDIKPILEANCLKCHNDKSLMTSVSFETREQILKATTERRPILVPGDPEGSTLFLVTQLPDYFVEAMPADGHKLSDDTTWKIYRWILEGADWPDAVRLKAPNLSVVAAAD